MPEKYRCTAAARSCDPGKNPSSYCSAHHAAAEAERARYVRARERNEQWEGLPPPAQCQGCGDYVIDPSIPAASIRCGRCTFGAPFS